MALASGRKHQILHSDQGCRLTISIVIQRLKAEKIKISCTGQNR
jgi:putative transposase